MALRLLVSAQGDPEQRSFRYDFGGDRSQILLGRRGGVDVLLPHAAVSLVHARIERRGQGYLIVDDGSTNGTVVNGARLLPGEARALARGDRIAIGEFVLAVDDAASEEDFPGESSISIARRMVAEVLGVLGPGDRHPTLTVLADGGGLLALGEVGRRYLIGSAPHCDLVLDDPTVSSEHAAIRRDYRGVTVSDLGSAYGLYVNDQFVAEERALRESDLLAVGRTRLRFSDPAETYLRRLEQVPTPEETSSGGTVETAAATPASGGGLLALVVVALLLALVAGAGLLYLWLF